DEQHTAMIADTMAPTRQAHLPADVALAEFAAFMAAIAVHFQIRRRYGKWRAHKHIAAAALSSGHPAPRQDGANLPLHRNREAGNAEETQDGSAGRKCRNHDHGRRRGRDPDRAWAEHDLRPARGAERPPVRGAVQGFGPAADGAYPA